MYGNAIHFSGDSVHSFINEVNDYEQKIPADLYRLIYFLDEDLGHWLLFASLFILIGFWTSISNIQASDTGHSALNFTSVFKTLIHGSTLPTLCGIFMGFSFGIAVIEGASVSIGIIAIFYLIGCSLYKMYWPKTGSLVTKSHHGNGTPYTRQELKKAKRIASATSTATTKLIVRPKKTGHYLFVHFSLSFSLGMSVLLAGYYILLGEFAEPSKIGGLKGIMTSASRRWLEGMT